MFEGQRSAHDRGTKVLSLASDSPDRAQLRGGQESGLWSQAS